MKEADLRSGMSAHYLDLANQISLQNAVLSALPQLLAYLDKNLVYKYANSSHKSWLGLPSGPIAGKTMYEVLGPALSGALAPAVQKALAGQTAEFHQNAPFPNGKNGVIKANFIPDLADSGEVAGILAVIADVTEREENLRLMAESEQRLQLIFDSAPVGIIQIDGNRRYISANQAFTNFIGYSFEELRSKTIFDVTHPEDLALTVQNSENFRRKNFAIRRLEKRYVTKAGATVWGMVSSQQVINPRTGESYLFTVIEDITELKKKEAELKSAETEIAHFFSASVDFMIVAGMDGFIRRANAAVTETLGYTQNELRARPFLDFVHPEDREATLAGVQKLWSGEPALRFENRLMARNGATRLFNWTAVPDVTTGLYYATGRDVTDLKNQEIKLAYSAKMASLGEMAGGLAHEVNNPLAIILGKATNLQRLMKGARPNLREIADELASIERTGQRIAKIIRGLRSFSRNADPDPMIATSLARIIDDTLALCAERLMNRNIRITIECPAALTVSCRPSQLSQVLMNLIGNAFDAVENVDDRWIRIAAEDHGRNVWLIVEDSGPGIEPRIRGKIMQPFFTTKEVGRGTGLGLSISKGIVEDHRGQLRFDESAPHTRFVVELPLD